MSDEPTAPRRSPALMIGIATVAVAVLVVIGLIAAGNTGPAEANLTDGRPTASTSTTTTDADTSTPPERTPLRGTGSPISVSGTDPVTGASASLSSLTGKPVVLTIWASWCPGCNEEAPHLAAADSDRDEVHFFGINYRDSRGGAKDFYEKYGLSMPSVEDADGGISLGLALQGTPTTIFLDASHREVGRVVGALSEDGLNDAIDQLIGA